jgi:ubiquinone/menaquinone biosynthesis C-methylase UbiE
MSLHPLAQRFEGVAAEYERGRPDYPPAAVGALAAELRLGPGAPVLDLAAGTGKLSRALIAGGLDVVAVEPLAPLREMLGERIGSERVRDGVAEQIPLSDHSVDAVTVADGFHWFDQAVALTEIARVLRRGGGLAILSMVPDWSGASWAHELGTLVADARPEHPHFDGPPWQDAVRACGGWTRIREIRVTSTQATSPERIVDHMSSMSWIAGMAAEERAEAIRKMREVIESGETPREMPIHVVIGLAGLAA